TPAPGDPDEWRHQAGPAMTMMEPRGAVVTGPAWHLGRHPTGGGGGTVIAVEPDVGRRHLAVALSNG
ncbi:MAG: hypothetical protein GY698_24345, partial [Actinomycetia bacterium]|nr:hypothetical protein [Actinomycetes bacterium]